VVSTFILVRVFNFKKTSIHIGNKSSVYELLMSYASRTRYGSRSNYTNRSFGSKPVETGKEYNVQITETSRKGDGIARIQGFVIFVKDAQMGQDVKAKVTSVGERFATAEIVV
jgi:predicted RNA-binding protein with TRAM domain